MHTLTRIAFFFFVLLSLSFLVSAIPVAPRTFGALCSPTGSDHVSVLLIKILADLELKINALLGCGTKAELDVAINCLVAVLKGCADDLLKIGAGVSITVEAKASIVACVCSIITLLAKVCVDVSAKFGILVVLSLFAKIDHFLKGFLVNLNICIGGILVLIAKDLASVTIGLLGQIHLGGCLGILGLVRLTIGL